MYSLINDEDTLKDIGHKIEYLRRTKGLSDDELSRLGGVSLDAIYRIKKGKNINLLNFIKILRALDKIDALESLLNVKEQFSPVQAQNNTKLPKKIHKSKTTKSTNWQWGEDE